MYDTHLSYYEKRAETELGLAQQAVHPAAAKAHYLLAGLYLDFLYGPDRAAAPSRTTQVA